MVWGFIRKKQSVRDRSCEYPMGNKKKVKVESRNDMKEARDHKGDQGRYPKDTDPKGMYQDILYLEHPTSRKYPRMSASDRAAQFSPFAALTGYGDAVEETGRLTAAKKELGEYDLEQLNRRLQLLQELCEKGVETEVTITYFCPDEKKDGGSYSSYQGRIKKVDAYRLCLVMTDGWEIAIDEIMEIDEI